MTAAQAVNQVEHMWSRYWAEGHLHSCPTSFAGYYGPQTQAFWRNVVRALGPSDAVLELGCGNAGLLALLAAMFPVGEAPSLMGVDAAALDNSQLATQRNSHPNHARICVMGRTRFDSLGLESASVTALISQFAFEYGATDAAWAELWRVLAPSARIACVVHKSGSLLDHVARDELTLIRQVAEPGKLLELAGEMIPLLDQASTSVGRERLSTDSAAVAIKANYNSSVQSVMALGRTLPHGGYADDLLRHLTAVLGRVGVAGVARSLDELAELRQGLDEHRVRLEALRAAALDTAGLDIFRERLEQNGFSPVSISVLHERGEEMGWALEGIRE